MSIDLELLVRTLLGVAAGIFVYQLLVIGTAIHRRWQMRKRKSNK